jgi:hypothetical protein
LITYSFNREILLLYYISILNKLGKEITVKELVNQYYSNPERYFQLDNDDNKNKGNGLPAGPDNDGDGDNKDDSDSNNIHKNTASVKEVVSEYYAK